MTQEERHIKKQKYLYIKNLYDECIFWANYFNECKRLPESNYWLREADRYEKKLNNPQPPTP